jgi:hypothetical protein
MARILPKIDTARSQRMSLIKKEAAMATKERCPISV